MHAQVAAGEATLTDDQLMFFARRLPREEVYVTFGYSPIRGLDGETVEGVFCACTETTEKVVGERRLATLGGLAAHSSEQRTAEAACGNAAEVLADNFLDVPFAAVYLIDDNGETARMVAGTRLDDRAMLPDICCLRERDGTWPLGQVADTGQAREVANLPLRVGGFPAGDWPDPVETAFVLPLPAPTQARPAGFLIIGVSPRRVLDAGYRNFLDLVAGHIATSIADARAFEAERKRVEALAEIDRAKTAFFSNVSHEFRTPLTLIIGPLEDALGLPTDDVSSVGRDMLTIARRNAARLLRMVNTLLDFSRVEAGRFQATYLATDLAALTAAITSNFRSACERAGLALEVDCPPLDQPIYVDHEMWEKIVLNLLSNAFKFTPAGGIRVAVSADAHNARLSVRDTGVGIAAAELPRLFERFHRIEGQQGRSHEGTGIGLALMQELVRLHGGTITVHSEVGTGSTFTVAIPFGPSHLPADRIGAAQSLASSAVRADSFVEEVMGWLPDDSVGPATQLIEDFTADPVAPATTRRTRILLADDNADMRAYVRHLLAPRSDVETVADGQAALEAARGQRPDLVLADVMMPRLDGLAMLSAFRRDPELRDLPVILLSARAGEEARAEGLQAGADDYLVKPFSARELIARIDSMLVLAGQRAEELSSMRRLNELSARLTATTDLQTLLYETLDATMALHGADSGNIQLFNQENETLEICAQRGFDQTFLDYFRIVTADDGSSCGMALRDRRRVIIEDVLVDADFAPHRRIATASGFRAVQSTPLFDRKSNSFIGVLSTHFPQPHRPSERALWLTDLYAQQAADVIAFRLGERRLRESEARLKAAVDLVGLGWHTWDPQNDILDWDHRVKAMWGLPPDARVTCDRWQNAIHPDDRARVIAAFESAIDPQQQAVYDLEYRVIGITDEIERWVASRGITSFENGVAAAFFGVTLDITNRKRTEQDNLLLIAELQHRTRNLLGLVRAISDETLTASPSLEDFRATFGGRLAALSRVQDLLFRGDIAPVTIGELVRLQLMALGAPLNSQRVAIDGPEVALPTRSVQILALALHELATNARKYGALAAPDGQLAVAWSTTNGVDRHGLTLEWRERGVAASPGPAGPSRKGFGRTLIEEALPYQLDAATRLEFAPDGVFCSVTIELDP